MKKIGWVLLGVGAVVYFGRGRPAEPSGKDAKTPLAVSEPQGETPPLDVKPKTVVPVPPSATAVVPEDVKVAMEESQVIFKQQAAVTKEAAADPHGTPASIMAAGKKIGEIAELQAKHPELRSEFEAFYMNCVRDETVITVTRVQCLMRYVKSAGLGKEEVEALLGEVPVGVAQVYRRAEM